MRAPIWLLLLVCVLVAANGYAIVGTLEYADINATLALPFAPWTRVILALIWIVLLTALLVGLLRRIRLAFKLVAPLLTLYGFIGLAWNIVFAQSTYSRGSLDFTVLLSVVVLVPVWWITLRRDWLGIRTQSRGTG